MPTYRVLKEEPVPEKDWTDDLSSHSRFVDTGETIKVSREKADAFLANRQTEAGGSWGLLLADEKS